MGRPRIKDKITYKNIWVNYPHRYDVKHSFYCNRSDFRKINEDFREMVSKLIIEDGYVFNATKHTGSYYIKKFKAKKRQIDFYNTKKHFGEENKTLPPGKKKKIYHSNEHSDGYSGRWWWKSTKWVRNHYLYKFYPVRKNKRDLSSAIKNNNSIIEYTE